MSEEAAIQFSEEDGLFSSKAEGKNLLPEIQIVSVIILITWKSFEHSWDLN